MQKKRASKYGRNRGFSMVRGSTTLMTQAVASRIFSIQNQSFNQPKEKSLLTVYIGLQTRGCTTFKNIPKLNPIFRKK